MYNNFFLFRIKMHSERIALEKIYMAPLAFGTK